MYKGAEGIVIMAKHTKLGLGVALKFHKHRQMRDSSVEVLQMLSSQYVAALISEEHSFEDYNRYVDHPYVMVIHGGEINLYHVLENSGSRGLPENQLR